MRATGRPLCQWTRLLLRVLRPGQLLQLGATPRVDGPGHMARPIRWYHSCRNRAARRQRALDGREEGMGRCLVRGARNERASPHVIINADNARRWCRAFDT